MIDNHSDKINVYSSKVTISKSEIQKITKDGLTFKSNKTKSRCASTVKNVSVFLLIATTNLKFGYLDSPIVMLLTPDDLTGDFYLAAVSQGDIYLKI